MKPLHLFLLLTFGLFLVGFAIAGVLISTGSPQSVVVVIQVVMAWTPTFAYAAIHRRVNPQISFWRFVAGQFSTPVRLLPLLASILIPVIAVALVVTVYSIATGTALSGLFPGLSAGAVGLLFLTNIIRGPLGEELGWRGYLLGEFRKRHSVIRASLIVGLIWGLWHLPLWLVSGYQGVDLILYSLFFLASIVGFSVVIGFIHVRSGGNLLYAILLHQMLNFTAQLVEIDLLVVLGGSAVVYAAIALVMGVSAAAPRRRAATA